MRIYLDNNATTRIHPEVLAVLDDTLRSTWGNPSSIHEEGQQARRVLEEARASVAALIHAEPRDIVFTSGGTESNNAAIYGSVLAPGRPAASYKIVTTAIEHPSVLEPVRDLASRGGSAVMVRCGADGVVSADEIVAAITPATGLVCVMLANNETGAIQPVESVALVCRERGIHLHCDAVQAAGKIDVDVERLGADTVALSAHKMHAPKGIGALWVRRGSVLHRHLTGGAQERRRRAGTEAVPLAAAFGGAARLAMEGLSVMPAVGELRDRLERGIAARIPAVRVNAVSSTRLPNTSSLTLPGIDGEALVISLDLAGVAISTGSACSSGRLEPSAVLLAMGLSEPDARSSVRLSLSRFTTSREIDRAVELLCESADRAGRGRVGAAHR